MVRKQGICCQVMRSQSDFCNCSVTSRLQMLSGRDEKRYEGLKVLWR